ncbi:MAG: lipoprotein-releasing system ATP-binding protein [Rhodothermales bacterium]|jgi:lipoprotein-releasing system ATP-binding protein
MALLELKGVSRTYGDGDLAVEVLKPCNLSIEAGETVAVVGPSGSGKSTLLHLIGTLDSPSAGEIHIDGQDVSSLNDNALAALRNRSIGFIFQDHSLLPQCSALENVLLPTLATGTAQAHRERASELLAKVGLAERAHQRPGQLSGGECQRVAVVRALINDPKLLLCDEPTGALDRANADQLVQLLLDLNEATGATLILVTHDPTVAERMQRTLRIADGVLD